MGIEIQGTVTRRSNGSLTITPKADSPTHTKAIEVYEGPLSSKQLPAMGDDVTVTIEITQPVEAPPPAPIATPVPVTSVAEAIEPSSASPLNRRKP